MKKLRIMIVGLCLISLLGGCVMLEPNSNGAPIEPDAAHWETWVLSSSSELRPPPPPDAEATKVELAELRNAMAEVDDEAQQSIVYWDAGSPNYRWIEIAMQQFAGSPPGNRASRGFSLLNVAIYDAIIATWDAKYEYNRMRPTVGTSLIEMPSSPSYPSEHAAAAGAASVVLSYLFPDQAELFVSYAEQAATSRVQAGVHFPSDVVAGLALGQAVGDKVIARAMTDGFDTAWTGDIPVGPGMWNGENPVSPLGGTWLPWTLTSGDQFRVPQPPAHDSVAIQEQLAQMKALERTPEMLLEAYFRRTIGGSYFYWLELAGKLIAEQHLDDNPPQAALIYSALGASGFDSSIACFDSKYAYWYIRPSQLDPEIEPLFGVPSHPSYPAAHSCASYSSASILSGFFPADADEMLSTAHDAGLSRVWGNIHYPMDIDAGEAIGKSVAIVTLERVEKMIQP